MEQTTTRAATEPQPPVALLRFLSGAFSVLALVAVGVGLWGALATWSGTVVASADLVFGWLAGGVLVGLLCGWLAGVAGGLAHLVARSRHN
jgi:hypothetical protein